MGGRRGAPPHATPCMPILEQLAAATASAGVVLVYLEAPVDIVHRRLQSRGRHAESSVTREYLHDIERAYERLLAECDLETHRVDATQPTPVVAAAIWRHAIDPEVRRRRGATELAAPTLSPVIVVALAIVIALAAYGGVVGVVAR